MRLSDATGRRRRSLWAYYPWFMAAAMLLVFAVNGVFIADALGTFPGAAANDGFDMSNDYDRVLAAVDAQNALGWDMRADVDAGHPVLLLKDKTGQGLAGADVTATATRPLGAPTANEISFRDAGGGRYFGSVALPMPGQWELALRISAQGHGIHISRRVLVK